MLFGQRASALQLSSPRYTASAVAGHRTDGPFHPTNGSCDLCRPSTVRTIAETFRWGSVTPESHNEGGRSAL